MDQIFGQGFEQGFGEGKNHKSSTVLPGIRKNLKNITKTNKKPLKPLPPKPPLKVPSNGPFERTLFLRALKESSSRFHIKHNPFEYLSYSLDRLIEHAAHDSSTEKLFTDFLDQYLLLENKGNWFPKKDILGLLNALYHQRNSYGMEFALHESDDG